LEFNGSPAAAASELGRSAAEAEVCMGFDAILYGRIVTPYLSWPPDRNGRLLQSRNLEILDKLPAKEQSPSPLVRGMFAVPDWNGGLHIQQVIPFGGSFYDDEMSRDWWEAWLGKFESLLRRLYWKSVVLHMESTFAFCGHRVFRWQPTEKAEALIWADEPQPIGEWVRTVQVMEKEHAEPGAAADRPRD
jgi:hypothetical protein